MDVATVLRDARRDANLSQAELASRAGTSQATISAYESGAKTPSLPTLTRLLAATGRQLRVEAAPPPARALSRAEQTRAGRKLVDVIALAEALPSRHAPRLRFPRLPPRPTALP
jgi:transcriptional regulator with XRE-family HTH domain